MSEEKSEAVKAEGAEDLPGGSAPGGADAKAGEGVVIKGDGDPMIDEPSEGAKGGARTERDEKHDVPDSPATQAEGGES